MFTDDEKDYIMRMIKEIARVDVYKRQPDFW